MASQVASQDYLTRLKHAVIASAGSRSEITSSAMSTFLSMSAADSLLAS